MNAFVNPKKRSIQLPKGAKDLATVLQPTRDEFVRKGKCDYCGAPAVAVSVCYAIPGVMDEEIRRWCELCQQDLGEFARRPENSIPDDVDLDDDAAMEREALRLADIERRRKAFMRQRVKERPQQ